MDKRRLGRTGYEVGAVGFGAWGLGGDLWRGVDPRDAQRALYAALDAGVDFVDTALAYGEGDSERLVGEVIRDLRARDWAVVATKVPPRQRAWPAEPHVPLEQVLPAEYVVGCVEQSLRNLRAEALCLEQLHVWHDAWLDAGAWPELRAAMARMVKEGKVLHWGVSVNAHAPETALRLAADPLIETVQVVYNVFDRSAERELFALARERELGVIARVPFDEGALTGALGPGTEFPPHDWRRRYFGGGRLAELAPRLDRLRQLLGDEARTLPELALRFCLSSDAVGVVIPGMRRVEHVHANLAAAAAGPLSPALRERLAEHAWDKNWYDEPYDFLEQAT
jgi:aryl-alcohol dehydrogenase-like predicted oxidoreductase